ncbi:MAG: cytochrome c oxidase subunit II [Actinomycetota bacterium]|nr:cytochrome c oxidase subunit II [Actinomycetota bacterium]
MAGQESVDSRVGTASRLARGMRRFGPLAALALVLTVVLAGCGGMQVVQDQPFSTLTPKTQKANDIHGLYQIVFWASLVVFIVVQFAIAYAVLKFRRRSDERPAQIHGSRTAEMIWTIIPAVVLLIVFIPTARTIYDHAAAEDTADFEVDVYGKQWWWEVHYPDIPANEADADAGPLVTANEIMVPHGANVVFNLRSNNVIHSFWVPQLSGKLDVMPGHNNRLQFTADTIGEFYGECAEFCGGAHAWMRFKVLVVPQEEFDAWVAAMRQPPAADANPDTPDVAEVPASFAVCLVCHNIAGTNATIAKTGLSANPYSLGAGPDLTLLACRDTIAAGVLENTPQNMEQWLKHTDEVKDGVYMPNYYAQGQIDDAQVAELVEYLMSLKPAGGCPEDPPVGGDPTYETTNLVINEPVSEATPQANE